MKQNKETPQLNEFTSALLLVGGLACWIALSSESAQAAYRMANEWPTTTKADLNRVKTRPEYAQEENLYYPELDHKVMDRVIRDREGRIDASFKIPPGMEDKVRFWLNVYTRYSTHQVVFFDSHNLDVIYDIVDFRDLASTARNEVVYEILRKRKLEARLREFRHAIERLRHQSGIPKTSLERKIVSAWKKSGKRPVLTRLYSNLRTQTGQRDAVIQGLIAADEYFQRMEQIFESMGLPKQLTRLSLVESSFNTKAISKVGATGVWQFMHQTGTEFMLIDSRKKIDERLSPLKSTAAAARLLLANYQMFDNWPLAITAYNYGPRKLLRVPPTERAHSKIGRVFDENAERFRLGFVGRNYYAEFLAMLHAEAYRDLFYGKPRVAPSYGIAYLRLDRPKNLVALSLETGVSLARLAHLNPDIRDHRQRLPAGFAVAFPAEHDDIAALTRSGIRLTTALVAGDHINYIR